MQPINRNWIKPDGTHDGGMSSGIGFTIAWQRGPLLEEQRNGAVMLEVLGACRSQLEHFQNSPYKCEENERALAYLEKAMTALIERQNRRKSEGTWGTAKP
jgi:hypothetical protein